jgi:hypothetical protein
MKLANAAARELAHRDEGERSLRSEPIDTPASPRDEERPAWPRNRETCLQGRAIDEVCPRSGPVTHHATRPTIWANIPELEGTA